MSIVPLLGFGRDKRRDFPVRICSRRHSPYSILLEQAAHRLANLRSTRVALSYLTHHIIMSWLLLVAAALQFSLGHAVTMVMQHQMVDVAAKTTTALASRQVQLPPPGRLCAGFLFFLGRECAALRGDLPSPRIWELCGYSRFTPVNEPGNFRLSLQCPDDFVCQRVRERDLQYLRQVAIANGYDPEPLLKPAVRCVPDPVSREDRERRRAARQRAWEEAQISFGRIADFGTFTIAPVPEPPDEPSTSSGGGRVHWRITVKPKSGP